MSPDTNTGVDVLETEREQLRYARECLVIMRESTDAIADYGVDQLASQSLGRMRAERLAALDAEPDAPPFFGRTDRDDTGAPRGEPLHIGRRHVRDPQLNPVVIDWRAPVARAFYQATPKDRMGVTLRRRFGFRSGELTSYEDEHLDRGDQLGIESRILRDEIERPRVGPMRDIVSTIQPDQDELVRADLDTSLCIQGAPGTGKTAVGLHRAAYLLYSYPDRLRRTGVLVVGPNVAFLHYIGQVLPALGEGGIEQTTVDELVLAGSGQGVDATAVAVLKGDPRMADLLRRAIQSHIAKPADDVVAVIGTRRYRVGAHHVRRYVDDARREFLAGELRWEPARERLRWQIAEDVRRQREANGGAPTDAETGRLARSQPVRAAVDAVWPALDPSALLVRLYTDKAFRDRCGSALTAQERSHLTWQQPPRTVRTAPWTVADRVLLDELAGLISGCPAYVHVVVDEAQDLSAMQCRAIARRSPLGSMTVLGDLAQATTPWAPGTWAASLTHLGHADAGVRPLTVGYRVPGPVLVAANRLLPHIAPELPPATSVRSGGAGIEQVPTADLVAVVRAALTVEGSVGVIVADRRSAAVLAELTTAGLPARSIVDNADPRVVVVASTAAKGLEFDTVVLVEPGEIVEAEPTRISGLRRLYVVMTRAVSRLVIVHDEVLPTELGL